jgi:tRNA G10  N-methylase Trm11
MSKSLFILGRQPLLGLAELESVFDTLKVEYLSPNAAIVDEPIENVDLKKLGGSLKVGEFIEKIEVRNWENIKNYVEKNLINEVVSLPEGKIQLGISCYGISVQPQQITGLALNLKKSIKKNNRSVRIIPNIEPDLSTAQVEYNHLTGSTGYELLLVLSNNVLTVARTVYTQDISAYAARDQRRPKRDAKVGMLPPKLAQIMINLAHPSDGMTILDPFCGTGVILQESLLMGYETLGSDLDPRMVDYSYQNLEWLENEHKDLPEWKVELGDAPLFKAMSPFFLKEEATKVNDLVEKFLTNLASQLNSGTRLCIAVPAWKLDKGFLSLQVLDHLEKIGYNSTSLKNVPKSELIYHRPQQLVARQLLILEKK